MRRRVLIAALVCGGFGIGVSEFIVMGLLPQIAADLVPELYAQHRDAALAATGALASSYALGVVIGMVVTPVAIRRLSERRALLICAGGMLLFTALTALAPTLAVAAVLRFLAALTHASFIGVGAMAVAHMLGHHRYGQGSAIVHGGLAAANLLGVPALTALGQTAEWRLILGGGALLFAVPFVALLCIAIPASAGYVGGDGAPRSGVLAPRLIVLAAAAVLVAAGGFAVVTYVAPVVDHVQGPAGRLTAAMAMLAFGVGMNLGNVGAGWVADRAAVAAFWLAAGAGIAGAALLLLPGVGSVGAACGLLLVGVMLGGGSPAAQVLFLGELRRFPRLASSMPSGTANLGSFAGSLVGAGLLAGVGPGVVPVGAIGLVVAGLGCFLLVRAVLPNPSGFAR